MFLDLLRQLFWGGIPPQLLDTLKKEGPVLSDEGIMVVTNYWKYRSPKARFGRRRHGWMGFVALTNGRFVGSGYSSDYVELPFDKVSRDNLTVALDRGWLKLSFNAEDFAVDRSGRLECRYRTTKARVIADRLMKAINERSPDGD